MATTKILFSIEQKKKDLFKAKASLEQKTITEVLVKFVDGYIGKGSPEKENIIPPEVVINKLDTKPEVLKTEPISEKAENLDVPEEAKTIPVVPRNPKTPFKTFFKKP
jgi:hypothetical protein